MKKSFVKSLSLLFVLSIASIPNLNKIVEVVAGSNDLPTTINLNDNTEQEIRNYYSSLSSLPEDELKGANLLKNLKKIISKENVFYDYGGGTTGVGAIYMITDRNWEASPASSLDPNFGNYDASTNTISNYTYKENPYIFHYYVDRDYQKQNPIKHKEDGASRVSFDKEHIWAKSHGFGLEGDSVVTGAGTDLHHLVAANPSVNSAAHNAYSYGNVLENAYKAPNDYLINNKRGTPKNSHSQDEVQVVFEPQDSDKGDIARALFYMVARYNYIGDNSQPTKEEPNLSLVNYIIDSKSGFDCSTTKEAAPYGIISDIYNWNKLDHPDQYEIHRNNLIYNNYQFNRNPFIDFPQWIELIFNEDGTYYSGEKFANPNIDELNVGSEYVEPPTQSQTDIVQLIRDNLVLFIIVIIVVIIIFIIIIVLVNKGKAKIKVSKKGKVSVKINSSSKTNKKKNSTKKTNKKK